MKIWIDLTNSPHINFFKPFINKWNYEGHEIILTARNLANTIDLIHQNDWGFHEVGGHAGKSRIKKVIYFPNRVLMLRKYLKNLKPDIGISHSSFYSPLVCKLLGIPSIYLNDNEHAKGNLIAFRYATLNILPEFLREKAESLGWTKKFLVKFYPGIKEGVYLSKGDFDAIKKEKKQLGDDGKIYMRLEPWTAEYYSGNSDFLDPVIEQLSEKYSITILPRSEGQAQHFKQDKFAKLVVADKPITLEKIYSECKLFIGAGGSMTRELAFLGIPTLSVYQGDLLEVDKYLIENNYMYYKPRPKYEDILDIIENESAITVNHLYEKGTSAFDFVDQKLHQIANTKK